MERYFIAVNKTSHQYYEAFGYDTKDIKICAKWTNLSDLQHFPGVKRRYIIKMLTVDGENYCISDITEDDKKQDLKEYIIESFTPSFSSLDELIKKRPDLLCGKKKPPKDWDKLYNELKEMISEKLKEFK